MREGGGGSGPHPWTEPDRDRTPGAATHSFWLSPVWLLGWKSLTMMPSCRMFSTNFSRCSSRWSNFSAIGPARHHLRSRSPRSQVWACVPTSCFRPGLHHFRFLVGGASRPGGTSVRARRGAGSLLGGDLGAGSRRGAGSLLGRARGAGLGAELGRGTARAWGGQPSNWQVSS